MAGYQCKCGFTSTRAVAVHRHLELNRGEHHALVATEEAAQSAALQTEKTEQAAAGQAQSLKNFTSLPATPGRTALADSSPNHGREHLASSGSEPDKSLMSRLGSWWQPAAGVREHALESLESSLPSMSEPAGPSRLPTADLSPAGSLEDADATWEPVEDPAVPDDSDGYARITSMLRKTQSRPDAAGAGEQRSARLQSQRRSLALDKAVDLLNWGRQSVLGDPASNLSACHRMTADMADGGPKLTVSADDVQSILLWQDSWQASKVFAAGLYMLICLRALVLGNHILQPTSAAASLCLIILLYHQLHRIWLGSRGTSKQAETELQQQLANRLIAVNMMLVPSLSAAITLIFRCLSGKDGLGASVWLGIVLWSTACLGESHFVSQPGMLLLLWVGAFTLPLAYVACRSALDSLVEEAVQAVADLVRGGQRGTLYTAAGLGAASLVFIGGKIILRTSVAAAIVGGFLTWKFWSRTKQDTAEYDEHARSHPTEDLDS